MEAGAEVEEGDVEAFEDGDGVLEDGEAVFGAGFLARVKARRLADGVFPRFQYSTDNQRAA